MEKYVLTSETKSIDGRILYRIKAIKDFGDVASGDLGGWIEKKENLSNFSNSWVYENACVYGSACVYENARIYGSARVYGAARIYGDAWIHRDARIY